jgi:hypothetical protein
MAELPKDKPKVSSAFHILSLRQGCIFDSRRGVMGVTTYVSFSDFPALNPCIQTSKNSSRIFMTLSSLAIASPIKIIFFGSNSTMWANSLLGKGEMRGDFYKV